MHGNVDNNAIYQRVNRGGDITSLWCSLLQNLCWDGFIQGPSSLS